MRCHKPDDIGSLLGSTPVCRRLAAGRAFAGWHEGELAFPPTFKFKRGTTQYLGHDEVVLAPDQGPAAAGAASGAAPLMPVTVGPHS